MAQSTVLSWKSIIAFLKQKWSLVLTVLLYVLFKLLYLETGMFWDSITILSKPATYLYNHGLFNFHYPSILDNGDPQLGPFYIAIIWKILGRNLFTTHLAFIPILIIILFELYRLTTKLFSKTFNPYVFALLAIDPTFMSQSIGLYQDAFLILFSLLIINGFIDKNKLLISIGMFFLCLVSRRGMLVTFAFMLANFINIWIFEKNTFIKSLKAIFSTYFPAVVLVISFISWRLNVYGWFFTTQNTNSGEMVQLSGIIKNLAAFVRWFIDDGRAFLWIIFTIIFFRQKNKVLFITENRLMILLFISLLQIMMCVTIPIANPFGARYFTMLYLIFGILLSKLVINSLSEKKSKTIITALMILLFSGNFWVYPEKLSQSWDSSLSNLSYFQLRKQTINYFERQSVDFKTVGVGFPMYANFDYIDINNDNRNFEGIDFKQNKWIVYSNIFNSADDEIDKIKSWIQVKEFKEGNVFIKIYKKPN